MIEKDPKNRQHNDNQSPNVANKSRALRQIFSGFRYWITHE
jgi:hypothetical protein